MDVLATWKNGRDLLMLKKDKRLSHLALDKKPAFTDEKNMLARAEWKKNKNGKNKKLGTKKKS